MRYLVGIDPGFASIGVALYDIKQGRFLLVDVIETKKSKERKVLARDDNVRRFNEIVYNLRSLVPTSCTMAIEGMSHPRDARAAWKLALGWGAILACAEMVNATTEQFAPMEIKRVITGNRTASKELMIKTITELRPEIEWPRKKSTHEHAADAIGAALTWLRAYDYEW